MARTVNELSDVVPRVTEVFREFGYGATSLALISSRTGIGKGSLYHFFPGGKTEMAAASIAYVSAWFEEAIFGPLAEPGEPGARVNAMLDTVTAYFESGHRVCLAGAFALQDTPDELTAELSTYFQRWRTSLATALGAGGLDQSYATQRASEIIARIQGALVLSRAWRDSDAFDSQIASIRSDLRGWLHTG